jgi:hypothetical protein
MDTRMKLSSDTITSGRLAFRFTAQAVWLDQGMPFHALPVPADIAAAWKKAKVRRLVGTVNGHPIKRALMNHADGGSFIIVNRDFMKTAGIGLKTPATLAFKPDPAPEKPDIPEEFLAVLNQDTAARKRWDTFTPGRQRSLLVYITGARTEPTRIKRSLDLARMIRTHSLYGDKLKKKPVT